MALVLRLLMTQLQNDPEPAVIPLMAKVPVLRKNPFHPNETIAVENGSTDQPNEADRTNINGSAIQDGGQTGGVFSDATNSNPAGLATLLSSIVEEKLQTFRPASSSPPAPASLQSTSLSQPFTNPSFVASLLHQPGTTTGPLQTSAPLQASLSAHVPMETR